MDIGYVIYERLKRFNGIALSGDIATSDIVKRWEVVEIYHGSALCKDEDGVLKMFEICED